VAHFSPVAAPALSHAASSLRLIAETSITSALAPPTPTSAAAAAAIAVFAYRDFHRASRGSFSGT
ncbi:MAG: hypothetical protein ABJA10_04610, partial [Aestuariivirga sp.]